jgi:hypothetical protein
MRVKIKENPTKIFSMNFPINFPAEKIIQKFCQKQKMKDLSPSIIIGFRLFFSQIKKN